MPPLPYTVTPSASFSDSLTLVPNAGIGNAVRPLSTTGVCPTNCASR